MGSCPACDKEAKDNYDGDCTLLMTAYILAGLAMMLNIRLSYSSAPYALIRFRLPENLFSVFVRRMASALELWCLPSMLLGNIMDLTQKLIDENPELRAIKAEANDIQSKASLLKGTADEQSTIELGNTYQTDLQPNNHPQTGLTGKATDLKNKADLLSQEAQKLESAATAGPLNPLRGLATNLKEAAKSTSGGNDLYTKAQVLAGKQPSEPAQPEANQVIGAFDKVEENYLALMKQANTSELTNDPAVIEVVKAYHSVKNIYYQMLITFRIQQKATAFYSAANTLKAAQERTNPKLKALNSDASSQMEDLESTSNDLQKIIVGTEPDSNIVDKYLKVADKYKALMDKVKEQKAEKEAQVTNVKEKFEALQKSYENVLRLRVQELSDKAQALSSQASSLPPALNLNVQANLLANAASKPGGGTGLKQKAEALVNAINSNAGGGTKAVDVIEAFDTVRNRYDDLKNAVTPEQQQNVKAVDDAYTALKTVYDSILNVTKIKHYSTEVNSKAGQLASGPGVVKPSDVKAIISKLENVYSSMPDADIKSTVQSDFDSLKAVISGAMKCWKFYWIIGPSIGTQWLNFLTYVILLVVYLMGGDTGHLTVFYFVIAISGVVFGINMTLLYSVDFYYIPVYIVGENTFPILTSFIHYVSTLMFGNRRKWNSDFIIVMIDIWVAIIISFVAAVVWTYGYLCEGSDIGKMKHIHAFGFSGEFKPEVISPALMIVIGMGLVFTIYPGIAPGMIVPFYLVDKIEMVLLVATIFPPVIIAILRKHKKSWSPQHFVFPGMGGWKEYQKPQYEGGGTVYAWIWHFFDILMVLKISLAIIFIYSLHYRDSNISRAIVNQPKMSTFLSITYYMCHEILLALGFSGFIGNDGGDLILIPQYIGALFMIFLAFYSEGYIIEYKSHDPAHWPTTGMEMWNALCYWCKRANNR